MCSDVELQITRTPRVLDRDSASSGSFVYGEGAGFIAESVWELARGGFGGHGCADVDMDVGVCAGCQTRVGHGHHAVRYADTDLAVKLQVISYDKIFACCRRNKDVSGAESAQGRKGLNGSGSGQDGSSEEMKEFLHCSC